VKTPQPEKQSEFPAGAGSADCSTRGSLGSSSAITKGHRPWRCCDESCPTFAHRRQKSGNTGVMPRGLLRLRRRLLSLRARGWEPRGEQPGSGLSFPPRGAAHLADFVRKERDGIHTGMPVSQGRLNFVAVNPPRHGRKAETCGLVHPSSVKSENQRGMVSNTSSESGNRSAMLAKS
jgi:hypothetical protein